MQATKDFSIRETTWLKAAEWRCLQMCNREITDKIHAPKFIFINPSPKPPAPAQYYDGKPIRPVQFSRK